MWLLSLTTSKSDACHALTDVFPAHPATLAHNADHNTTSTQTETSALRYAETEKDSLWHVMMATILMEMAALVTARSKKVTVVLVGLLIRLILAQMSCLLRLSSPNQDKATSQTRSFLTLD